MDLYFDQIIGLPLQAIIKGETLAAKSTVDFIKQVGFDNVSESKNPIETTETNTSLGNMRTITFYYEAVDNTGSLVKNSLTVPLLSIIPIPVIQIQEAQLDYAVGITLVEQDRTTGAMALKTAFRETATGTTASSNYHIKINMKVGPSDVPSGLSNLFKIMENNLVSQQNI